MKWIVVILVLLNVTAYLFGLKVDPEVAQITSGGQYRIVNAEAMSVISPETAERATPMNDGQALEEDEFAQLKVDKRGEVLRAAADLQGKTGEGDGNNSAAPAQVQQPAAKTAVSVSDTAAEKKPAAPVIAPVDRAKIATSKTPESPVKSAQAALACYRLGPFRDQNSLIAVRRKLENENIQYRLDESSDLRNIKAVRVYLGVDSGDASIEAARQRLKSMNIEHYVIRHNGIPMVQLGYFSEPARATAYQKKLKSRGVEAKTETIYHEANINSWLEVQQASSEAIDSIKLPRGASAKKQGCK